MLFLLAFLGQVMSGRNEHNAWLEEHGRQSESVWQYLHSGHFLQATFENWESEFFQMSLFVMLTVFLRQSGSSESKTMNEPEFDKKELEPRADSPGPVLHGGLALKWYKNSLTIALSLLFVFSFLLHGYGSWLDQVEKQSVEGETPTGLIAHFSTSKFWFESFQNWQSEFLSVFSIIFLSIYLRQYGSSQSKAVNASHEKTGKD